MSILIHILTAIFALVGALMILVILMQRPKSEGLGAAFGGGVTENIFGAQTTNVLTRVTTWLAGTFFFLTFLLSILYARETNNRGNSEVRAEVMKDEGKPAATVPAPKSAVGAPGTVTNPTPGAAGPAVAPAEPLTPADQAVGITAPAPSAEAPAATTPAPSASGQPSPL